MNERMQTNEHAGRHMLEVRSAVLTVLCLGEPTYDRGDVGWGSPGLFSMLNHVADELLKHLYRGQTVKDAGAFYADTRLIGYGNVTLSAYFQPWPCHELSTQSSVKSETIAILLHASRYLVASHLLHLMYTPWVRPMRDSRRYALAVHLRRGDKLIEGRNSERIAIWTEDQVASEARALLAMPAAAAASSTRAMLLASDDNAFAMRVAERLVAVGMRVERADNGHDAGSMSPFDVCDESCIPPLLDLADGFARSSALMLSTKSNMGGFLLSWWAAANDGRVPPLLDMDAKVKAAQLHRGRYFCALQWGARRGMCESNCTERGNSN